MINKFRVVSALREEYPADFTHIYDVGFHSLKRKNLKYIWKNVKI